MTLNPKPQVDLMHAVHADREHMVGMLARMALVAMLSRAAPAKPNR